MLLGNSAHIAFPTGILAGKRVMIDEVGGQ